MGGSFWSDPSWLDAASRQVGQHGSEIGLAALVGRHLHEAGMRVGGFDGARRRAGGGRGVGVDEHRAGGLQDARAGGNLGPRIDHHAQRLQRGRHQAHVEPGVVVAHRADAGQHRAGAPAPGVAVGARGLAGDPLALAVGQRRLPVQ